MSVFFEGYYDSRVAWPLAYGFDMNVLWEQTGYVCMPQSMEWDFSLAPLFDRTCKTLCQIARPNWFSIWLSDNQCVGVFSEPSMSRFSSLFTLCWRNSSTVVAGSVDESVKSKSAAKKKSKMTKIKKDDSWMIAAEGGKKCVSNLGAVCNRQSIMSRLLKTRNSPRCNNLLRL